MDDGIFRIWVLATYKVMSRSNLIWYVTFNISIILATTKHLKRDLNG